jgi:hypothetical protein
MRCYIERPEEGAVAIAKESGTDGGENNEEFVLNPNRHKRPESEVYYCGIYNVLMRN